MPERTLRLTVIGRVQGVGFRAWVEDGARQRGLRGWVRNRKDGSVEAVLSGVAAAVAEMVEACETGPRAASVFHVDVADYDGEVPPRFKVLPTE
jgi:acylphosphatase